MSVPWLTQDVGRLDVAVDDAVLEGVVERAVALEDDLDRLLERQQRVGVAVLLERAARHVLHHDVRIAFFRHRIVDRRDVRMIELAGQGGFVEEDALKAPERVGVGGVGGHEHLDRDFTVREGIARVEDAAGRALAELAQHRILADAFRYTGLQEGGNVAHARACGDGFGGPARNAIVRPEPASLRAADQRAAAAALAAAETRLECLQLLCHRGAQLHLRMRRCVALALLPTRDGVRGAAVRLGERIAWRAGACRRRRVRSR